MIRLVSRPKAVNFSAISKESRTGKTRYFSKYSRGIKGIIFLVRDEGVEPSRYLQALDPKSSTSTIPPIPHNLKYLLFISDNSLPFYVVKKFFENGSFLNKEKKVVSSTFCN